MKLVLQINLYRRMQERNFIFLLATTLLLTFFFSIKGVAQGNLLITPRRIIFEGQKRMQELNLANSGKDTSRYLISFMEIRMKEDGTFEQITQPDSGQNFASNYLRIFPRNIVLAPGEAQVVKLQLIKTNQLVSGEYRSHIYFRSVPAPKPLGEKVPETDSTGISVTLVPVFGLTIPVIIKAGELSVNVRISDLAMTTGENMQPELNVVFYRNGNASVYGDLTVEYISPQGKTTSVGVINGIAVYTPLPSRKMRVILSKIPGIDYKTGKLHVIYTTSSERKDAKAVEIAAADLDLF